MNAEERLRVVRLVTRLSRAPEAPQDEDAALEVAALMKVRPDAPYLLLQRALMLELALEQAQAELQQLRQGQAPGQPAPGYAPPQSAGTAQAPSRWGGLFQRGTPAAANPGYPGSGPGYAPAYGPGAVAGQAPSAGGGFLRNAAAVGAGVLGGSLLFHGLDALFHEHDHPGAGGAGQGLLSGDMQSPLDAISGNGFVDPGQEPGNDPFRGDMLGDGGEFDGGGDDWA